MQAAMNHSTTPAFWECYRKLPRNIQNLANDNFKLLKRNPRHPSLHLKRVERYWSVRIGIRYRAIAVEGEKGLVWFWIGTHAEYDKLIH